MAKTVWKYHVPLGAGKEFELMGPIVFIEADNEGMTFWTEGPDSYNTYRVILHVVLTGELIPDKWGHVGSGRIGQFVAHLYAEFLED